MVKCLRMRAKKNGPAAHWNSRAASRYSSRSGLLEEASFFVETLCTRMQRDADGVQSRRCLYVFALGVATVQQLAGVLVPERFGDAIDQLFGLIRRHQPLCCNSQRALHR